MKKTQIKIYFLLTKLGSEGVNLRRMRHSIQVPPFSRISVQMLDGSVLYGFLEEYGGALPPVWISLPRILGPRDVLNSIRAYVRMSDGTAMSAVLHDRDVLGHSRPPAPLFAVSSIVQLRNGTSSRAVLRLLRNRNRAPVQFSTSGTSVFVGFPDGLVFTGMYEEVY